MIGIENAKHYARVEAIEYAKSLGLEVEVSEDRRWYIVGPFESQEKLSEFGEIAELLGLDTTVCLYAGCMLKFA